MPNRLASTLIIAALPMAATAQSGGAAIEYPNPTGVQRIADDAFRLDIGGSDVEFFRVIAIRPRRNGGFVVANSGTYELFFFDATGHRASIAGGRGRGPGEYTGMRDVQVTRGDSLVVFDGGARRVSILGPDGSFARSIPLQAPWDSGGSPTRVVAMPEGSVVVGYSEITTMAPRPEAVYFGQRLFTYAPDGSVRPGKGIQLPESEHFIQATTPERGGVAYWNLAFGRIMSIRENSGLLLAGDGTDWSITERRIDGSVVRTHRVSRAVVPVTTADRDGYGRAALANTQPAERAMTEKMVAEMPFPRTKPAYQRFEVDGAGGIWIESWPAPGATESEWIRLDPASRTASAVAFSRRFRPLAFTRTAVYGVWRDADDVEHVRIYPLGSR